MEHKELFEKRILIFFIFFLMPVISIFAESRNALLIANGKYKSFSSLANPVPEAEGLKKSLIELGFDVTIVTNASKEDMETAILDFQKKLSANKGIGFFHYGGHAVQVNGENYLIPADADIPDEPRVSSRAVNVSEIMYSMQADTNIVILDSCRNNPLPSGSGRSASRGLQMVKVRPKNSVIVYSAEAGKTAQDGVFTPILTKRILENKELIAVLRDVRNEVAKVTNDEQNPGQYDQLRNEVFLAANVPSRLSKVEAENAELDRQLEALRAKRAAAGSQEEQNRIAIETQKVEAEKKRKELELQQVRESEARRAAEQKRIAEENAKKNENQRLQEQKFAKMQADNAAKLKEIERLNTATNIDEMESSANSLYKTINNITDSYTNSMNKAISETQSFYQKKKATIVKSKYENEAEFAERRKSEESALETQQNDDITALKKRYENEIDDNTKELKRKLTALENQSETIVGNSIKLTLGEYNAEERFFPVVITDNKNPEFKFSCRFEVPDYKETEESYTEKAQGIMGWLFQKKVEKTRIVKQPLSKEEFVKQCIEIENKIKSGGYVGYIEYLVSFIEVAKKYNKIAKTVGINDVSNGKIVAKKETMKESYAIMERQYLRTVGFKFIGDNNIAVGDIAYECGKFSSKYIKDRNFNTKYVKYYKPIGIVFQVSPKVKILLYQYMKHIGFHDDFYHALGDPPDEAWYQFKFRCKNCLLDDGGWYMPDKDELNKICQNKEMIDRILKDLQNEGVLYADSISERRSARDRRGKEYYYNHYYGFFSSSSYDEYNAYYQDFNNGKIDKTRKSDSYEKSFTVKECVKSDNFIEEEKHLGDENIEIGDIAYEGGKFSKMFIPDNKPIGVVFAVSPKVKVVYLSEKQNATYKEGETMYWDTGNNYCKKITDDGGDWRMPDKDELNDIFLNKDKINRTLKFLQIIEGIPTNKLDGPYWSSSYEKYRSRNSRWCQYSSSGRGEYDGIYNYHCVRAVKSY